jgi:hypothetical protein
MKTFIALFGLIFFITFNTYAEDLTSENNSWDFFGLVLFPGVPTSSNDSNIAGIRAGIVSGGKNEVRGIEFAAIGCMTKSLYGLQTAPIFCTGGTIYGIQASPVNISDKVKGLQFGIFNSSKKATFQIGVINYNKYALIPLLPIINWNFSSNKEESK